MLSKQQRQLNKVSNVLLQSELLSPGFVCIPGLLSCADELWPCSRVLERTRSSAGTCASSLLMWGKLKPGLPRTCNGLQLHDLMSPCLGRDVYFSVGIRRRQRFFEVSSSFEYPPLQSPLELLRSIPARPDF